MTKNRTSMLKMLLSIALAVILSLGLALPAFAADDLITWPPGTLKDPAQAGLTKILKMPEGTITPEAAFQFQFSPISYNGKEDDKSKLPQIGDTNWIVKVDFKASNNGAENAGVKTVRMESGNFLEDIKWSQAGVYVYKVKEISGTYANGNTFAEKMTYSGAEYDLYVYVKQDENSGEYFVYLVGALIVKIDTTDGGKVGEKVDPTPGGEGETTKETYSKMIFTNMYLKNNGGEEPEDPEDPKKIDEIAVLKVGKIVDGAFGDKSKEFKFKVTIGNPATITDTEITGKAYIIDGKSVISGPLTFTAGTAKDIELKDGQWLAFTDLPVGSSFKVTEKAEVGYTPTAKVKAYKIDKEYSADQSMSLTIPGESEKATLDDTLSNSALFTNVYKDITPTGISVDDLPNIVMIAIALLALIGFTFIKYRAGAKSNA